MTEKITGVIPALYTPFDKNGDIDHGALKSLVEYNIEKGVSGFYVNGSTAEVFLLSEEERKSVYKTVADAAKGKVKLIAHVGAISTDQAISYGKYAKELGYDAISAVSPFYYKFSFDQIKEHYFNIVNSVDMPMLIYNIPVYTGVSLSVNQVSQFFSDVRFVGIKH
ncbi:MAG: dihydrodipicolinate synthase family protein, partial [Clostridia bacterium]|nr:dihydrodipicolinate synthase family protein [Clostridia bacterium]